MGINSEEKLPGVVVIRVGGDLDLYNVKEFSDTVQRVLEQPDVANILVDLTHLRFIDSSGFRVLVNLNSALRVKGGHFCVFGLDENIRKYFSRIITERIFAIYPDEASAMQNVR